MDLTGRSFRNDSSNTRIDYNSMSACRSKSTLLEGANVWLAHADNPVINPSTTIVIHPLLLAQHFGDNQQLGHLLSILL